MGLTEIRKGRSNMRVYFTENEGRVRGGGTSKEKILL